MTNNIKPFLKWAGGKYRILPILKEKFPSSAKRFIEPFLGAGSVSLNVNYPECIVNDTNHDLILVWTFLKNDGVNFINECEKLFVENNNLQDSYTELRSEFNSTKDEFRKASIFIYLNRHCFNGLCRYNKSGGFNVPFGRYDKPHFPKKELEQCIEKVKSFDIHNKDFKEIFELVQSGDLIYCDPPYVPASKTSNFSAYSTNGFSQRNQEELKECILSAVNRGATVLISNSITAKPLYLDASEIFELDVSRMISGKTSSRTPAKEIIAVYR